MAKTVVVVGGSLAGLMHGLLLKRQGVNVTIIEQDPSSERVGNEAGIGFSESVSEFLRKFDVTGVPLAIDCQATKFAWRKNQDFWTTRGLRRLSNWSLMYRILRANFDGLQSDACPKPPGCLPGDGKVQYRAGCKVTDLALTEDGVRVSFVDMHQDYNSIEADMVIGADGKYSTIRRLMNAPAENQYSGYITWRGTVPAGQVSPTTAAYFKDTVGLNFTDRLYSVVYPIPAHNGDIDSYNRLFNIVVYYNVKDDSSEMKNIFTNINGKYHRNTVPKGLVRPNTWQPILETISAKLAPPFAELVAKVQDPFVTKVTDALGVSVAPSFHEGRVLLVGDALTSSRPHIAKSTEQAAFHCLSLAKVWNGTITQKAWNKEAMTYAERTWLLSNILGVFGQGNMMQFLKCVLAYIFFLVRIRILGKYGQT